MGAAFELLMSEWHVTPDYVVNNWTDELLDLMIEKLVERRQCAPKAMRPGDSGGHKVPDSVLFARAKNLIKVVNN